MVKAATGEEVSAEDLGGANIHCRTSGVADHFANNDAHALAITRNVLRNLPNNSSSSKSSVLSYQEPLYSPNELNGIIPTDTRKTFDVREIIARVVDGSRFDEFKPLYGTTMVTGFSELYGNKVRRRSSSVLRSLVFLLSILTFPFFLPFPGRNRGKQRNSIFRICRESSTFY